MRSATIMFVYAAVLLGAGAWAYSAAPQGANAATALIVPGACALVMLICGGIVAGTARTNLRTARRTHLVALICALAFGAAFAQRGGQASLASTLHRETEYRFASAVKEGKAQDTPEARAAYFRSAGAPDHDKKYLSNTLWALMFVSAGAFLALLVTRPGGGAELLNAATDRTPDSSTGGVVFRRTTIDEVEVSPPEQKEFR